MGFFSLAVQAATGLHGFTVKASSQGRYRRRKKTNEVPEVEKIVPRPLGPESRASSILYLNN